MPKRDYTIHLRKRASDGETVFPSLQLATDLRILLTSKLLLGRAINTILAANPLPQDQNPSLRFTRRMLMQTRKGSVDGEP
jgi:hypothetical protein